VNGVRAMAQLRSWGAMACHKASHFCADEGGATAIEYAMVASGIGAFLATTVYTLGGSVKKLFTSVSAVLP
jgi:Flp pilus assembly pilin Flp